MNSGWGSVPFEVPPITEAVLMRVNVSGRFWVRCVAWKVLTVGAAYIFLKFYCSFLRISL